MISPLLYLWNSADLITYIQNMETKSHKNNEKVDMVFANDKVFNEYLIISKYSNFIKNYKYKKNIIFNSKKKD